MARPLPEKTVGTVRSVLRTAHRANLPVSDVRKMLDCIPGLSVARKDLLIEFYMRGRAVLATQRDLAEFKRFWSETDPNFFPRVIEVRRRVR